MRGGKFKCNKLGDFVSMCHMKKSSFTLQIISVLYVHVEKTGPTFSIAHHLQDDCKDNSFSLTLRTKKSYINH